MSTSDDSAGDLDPSFGGRDSRGDWDAEVEESTSSLVLDAATPVGATSSANSLALAEDRVAGRDFAALSAVAEFGCSVDAGVGAFGLGMDSGTDAKGISSLLAAGLAVFATAMEGGVSPAEELWTGLPGMVSAHTKSSSSSSVCSSFLTFFAADGVTAAAAGLLVVVAAVLGAFSSCFFSGAGEAPLCCLFVLVLNDGEVTSAFLVLPPRVLATGVEGVVTELASDSDSDSTNSKLLGFLGVLRFLALARLVEDEDEPAVGAAVAADGTFDVGVGDEILPPLLLFPVLLADEDVPVDDGGTEEEVNDAGVTLVEEDDCVAGDFDESTFAL